MRKQRLKGAVERSRRVQSERRSEVIPRCLQRGSLFNRLENAYITSNLPNT